MSELTPIIKYDGPEVQKKEWTKIGIELLKEIEKTQPGLAVRTQMKHFACGSTVFALTIRIGITRIDKLDIKVHFGKEEFKKKAQEFFSDIENRLRGGEAMEVKEST